MAFFSTLPVFLGQIGLFFEYEKIKPNFFEQADQQCTFIYMEEGQGFIA